MQDGRPKHYRPHRPPQRVDPHEPTTRILPGVVVTADEACVFLLMSAFEYAAIDCQETGCDICTNFVQLWHSVYQALPASHRLSVEQSLEDGDTRAPRVAEGF